MTSDDSSSNATTHYMILGAPDGNIGTYTTYTGSPSLYYAQPDYAVDCVSTSMLTELDIEEGPVTNVVAIPGAGAVSDKITINMVTEVSSTMTTYYSNSMYTATTSAKGAVCHQTYGVSPNVPLVVGKKYAAGSACDKYTIYSIVSEYSNGVVKDVGFRPVITIKEQ